MYLLITLPTFMYKFLSKFWQWLINHDPRLLASAYNTFHEDVNLLYSGSEIIGVSDICFDEIVNLIGFSVKYKGYVDEF